MMKKLAKRLDPDNRRTAEETAGEQLIAVRSEQKQSISVLHKSCCWGLHLLVSKQVVLTIVYLAVFEPEGRGSSRSMEKEEAGGELLLIRLREANLLQSRCSCLWVKVYDKLWDGALSSCSCRWNH